MSKIKNSSMFLLWAGAAISITEIYTGGLSASLGWAKGLAAILIGHMIGTLFLALGGYISFKDNKNAMEKVQDALGKYGVKFVALLNVLQLLGWSAVMILQGGRALNSVFPAVTYEVGLIIVGISVFVWAYSFQKKSKKINDYSVMLLLVFSVFLLFKVKGGSAPELPQEMSFIGAIELSIIMPISWLPLIGDYTKEGSSGKGVLFSSFFGYFIGSVLMYVLGFSIALLTGKDIIEFMAGSGIGIVSALIVFLSTVTTTFLDVYSAVISSKMLWKVKNESLHILIYCGLALLLAFFFPIEQYESFLYLIGSIFVPVYTVVILQYFFQRKGIQLQLPYIHFGIILLGAYFYYYCTNHSIGIPTVMTVLIIVLIEAILLVAQKQINVGGITNEK